MNVLATIEKEAAKNRKMMMIIVISVVICCTLVTCQAISSMNSQKKKIYALDSRNNIIVFNQVNENRQAEAEGHFRDFHQLFFNLAPEARLIEKNITKHALELIDKTGKVYYDRLMKTQFYSNLIVMNITQELQIDSIKISEKHPFNALLYGKIYMISDDVIKEKSLITSGTLRNTNHRSSQNPHAFIIEQFKILENNDLKEYRRR